MWAWLDSFGMQAEHMILRAGSTVKSKSEIQPNGLQSCLHHPGTWVSIWISLCLCFLLCEMGITALYMSEGCYKDERRWYVLNTERFLHAANTHHMFTIHFLLLFVNMSLVCIGSEWAHSIHGSLSGTLSGAVFLMLVQ